MVSTEPQSTLSGDITHRFSYFSRVRFLCIRDFLLGIIYRIYNIMGNNLGLDVDPRTVIQYGLAIEKSLRYALQNKSIWTLNDFTKAASIRKDVYEHYLKFSQHDVDLNKKLHHNTRAIVSSNILSFGPPTQVTEDDIDEVIDWGNEVVQDILINPHDKSKIRDYAIRTGLVNSDDTVDYMLRDVGIQRIISRFMLAKLIKDHDLANYRHGDYFAPRQINISDNLKYLGCYCDVSMLSWNHIIKDEEDGMVMSIWNSIMSGDDLMKELTLNKHNHTWVAENYNSLKSDLGFVKLTMNS